MSISLYAIMVIVGVDVALRYLFNKALGWSYDLISMYLMAAVFLLALSSTLRDDHHVRVDILFRGVPPRVRLVMELAGYILTAAVMAGIFCMGTLKFWTSFRAGDVVMTSIAWPTWISAALVPLGVGLLLVRLLFGIASLCIALFTGADKAFALGQAADGTEV